MLQIRRSSFLGTLLGFVGLLALAFQGACGGGGSSAPPPLPPVITSFTAAKSPVTSGVGTTLTAVFSNGTGAVTGGVGVVTSGTAVAVTPSADTTYTLVVTNSAGVTTSASVTVAVVAAPVATSLTAAVNPVPFGGSTTLTPTFSAGTGVVDQGIGTVTSGTTYSSGAITASKTFTLSVSNAAGTTVSKSVTLTPQTVAVATPSPAAAVRTVGTSTTFSAAVTGGATNAVTWTATAGTITAAGVWTAPATPGSATITATSADDATKSASTTVTTVYAPTTPVVTAPGQATAGLAGYTASTPLQPGNTFSWSITGGTITAGAGTNSVTFTPGASGTVGLSVTATNAAGTVSTAGTASVTIVPAPVATSLAASVNPVPYKGTASITPTFTGGTGVVDQGVGTVTSGTAFTSPAITASKTYTLTVTNAAGTTATTTLTLTPQTVAVGALSPAAPTRTVGTSTTFSSTVTGGATNGVTWTASAGSITSGGVWTAPATAGTATITATSVDDASKSASTTVTFVAAPATPVVTVAANVTAGLAGYTASVPAQSGMTFAWTVTGATVTAGAGTTSITFTPAASGTVGLSVTATNAAGTVSTAGTGSAAIVAAPVATGLAASVNPVPYNGTATLTPTFTGGTGAVDQGVGTVTSGTGFTSAAITASKTYTLTVTNAAGTTATASVTLAPQTVALTALSPASPTRTVSTTTTFSTSATGGALNTVTWSASAGSITSGGVWTAPATAGSATITATSVDDASKSVSTTVTVVPVPVQPVVTAPTYVTALVADTFLASVPAQAGMTFTWTVTGATVTAGAGTNGITFTPAASGTVTFSVVATNGAGLASSAGTASSSIVAAPVATGLAAAVNPVLFGGGTTITPTFSGGTGVVNRGIGTVTSGTSFASGAITDPQVFILTVTNQAGTAATASLTLRPQTVAVTAISPSAATVTAGSTTAFTATVTGAADTSVAWSSTGGSWSGNAWTAPAIPGSYTIRATSTVDTSKTRSTTVTVVNALDPVTVTAPTYATTGKAGYTASVAAQTGATYAWAIVNGTITAGAATRTVTFTAGSVGQVSLSCTVASSGGDSQSDTALVTVVPYATIRSFTSDKADVVSGGAAVLSAAYSGGTGVVTPGALSLASGASVTVNPTSTTTYTLTVTNAAGDTTTDTLTVTVGATPGITKFRANPAAITAGQGTLLSFTFTGTGVVTPGNIPVTSGDQLAVTPASTTTYTLTATNAAGSTTTATATVTVGAFISKFAYVANTGGGVSAYTLDDTTGALAELAGSPFDAALPALHVTSDPAGKFLFVVNGDGLGTPANTVTAYTINATTGDLTAVGTYATGTNPWASAVDPSGKFLYVRCESALRVYTINATTGALAAASTTTAAAGTGGVLVHPSGRQVYSVGRDSDQLQVFDLNATTGALTLNSSTGLPLGTGPLSLALNHTGEYLFTKSEGAAGSGGQECVVYAYHADVETGGLMPLAPYDTDLIQADSWHGVTANPTQSVIYITLATSANDFAAYAFNLATGLITPLTASPYDVFGGTGSDSLVVSRNGKWGLLTNYNGSQIAIGAVDPSTGALGTPTLVTTGSFPVSVTVVGTLAP